MKFNSCPDSPGAGHSSPPTLRHDERRSKNLLLIEGRGTEADERTVDQRLNGAVEVDERENRLQGSLAKRSLSSHVPDSEGSEV
ncbi:hypothetical protein Pmani_020437 [Petrolisthes manimaculis]|uniref:Uncharacterized protein n=1 Tax=Petrolisthes manimaculis TaxID=1843537 RepID=A0AAE1U2K9_9EUCA|nr:hypothetical protein Pmani_020437 [Petrolisthes manimaculis]